LKTWPKQLLGSLPLVIALPGYFNEEFMCTEPSHLVCIPLMFLRHVKYAKCQLAQSQKVN
jgi:hypothetical protein